MDRHTLRRWSPVTRTLWTDERFRGLSSAGPCSQTLWLYLLTGPEQGVIPGLFVSGAGSLTDRLGALDDRWTFEEVRRCIAEIRDAGMLKVSSRPALFWLPRAHKHRPPPNPNQVVGWRAAYEEMPECPLREEALATIGRDLHGKSREAFLRVFPDVESLQGSLRGTLQGGHAKAPPEGPADSRVAGGLLSQQQKQSKPSKQRADKPLGNPSETLSVTKTKTKKEIPAEPQRLAALLLDGICSHLPEHRKRVKDHHLRAWAVDIDKLIRIDGADPSAVSSLVRLVHHEGHPAVVFWRSNVLSGRKLRERYTQILAQARHAGALGSSAHGSWHTRNAPALRRQRDKAEQQGRKLTAADLISEASQNDKPSREDAARALAWLTRRA